MSLEQLPLGVLDSIVMCVDTPGALAALAMTCTALRRVGGCSPGHEQTQHADIVFQLADAHVCVRASGLCVLCEGMGTSCVPVTSLSFFLLLV